MDKIIKKYSELCAKHGFIRGLEEVKKTIDKMHKEAPLEYLTADDVFRALLKHMEKTISDLKAIQKKEWKVFDAKYAKGKEK